MTRINFTGRRRVARHRFHLSIRMGVEHPALTVSRLDLEGMALPGGGRVVLEAYRRASYVRIPAGTVADLDLPSGVPLREFESASEPLFRIKVIGVGEDHGKLLAMADRLRAHPEDDSDTPHTSLLTVVPHPLGQRSWKLDLEDGDPQLLISKDVDDWKEFATTAAFSALVLPEVLRQIVEWVLEDLDDEHEGEDTPRARWIRFLTDGLQHDPREAPEDDRGRWIDDLISDFCADHSLLNAVIEDMSR